MNPNYAQQVKAEINKMLDAIIIYQIERTIWVSLIVVVPKKNGKIRICVDYRQVIDASIKDNYPVPYIEHLLERVAGVETYSFIDGFSGYNQISEVPKDQQKTRTLCFLMHVIALLSLCLICDATLLFP